MAPKLYTTDLSPSARSVLLTAKAIQLELDLKNVSIGDGENLTPEYLKMNPQHTVPTLDDNGYYLWDSHAINIHLVTKYAKNDSLYPKDEQKKGIINQRLFFSASVFETAVSNIFKPIFNDGMRTIPQDKADVIRGVYDFLEKFLEGHDFIAGDSLTIADFSIVSSLSFLEPFVSLTQIRNPLLLSWFQRMQDLPYYVEANKIGSDRLVKCVQEKLA
ncbi:hypothetical protein RI129_008421 [Pyrocoelia pectoralis]|uniref:Glutathione S-transferase n=1 Tax=Pyrocoelia pectoralis TaxID=417401 RepID=A0AAN7VE40_9COLE